MIGERGEIESALLQPFHDLRQGGTAVTAITLYMKVAFEPLILKSVFIGIWYIHCWFLL